MLSSSRPSNSEEAGPSSRTDDASLVKSSLQSLKRKAGLEEEAPARKRFSLSSIRRRISSIRDGLENTFGEASLSPEEGQASHVSAARQAAINQLKARRQAFGWLHSGQDNYEEKSQGGMLTSARSEGKSSAQESAQTKEEVGEGVTKGEEEEEEEEEESAVSTAFLITYFIAGGAAGATSRTVVSPLERLKIIMQIQPKSAGNSSKGAYTGVVSGLRKMWHEEGFKGFMRGNGINCLRIVPYSAVQFSTYEILKNALKDSDGELDVPRRLIAGAIAGIASVVSTYPLDLVRSRISIASASLYAEAKTIATSTPGDTLPANKRKPARSELRKIIEERQKKVPGIWDMTVKVYREEGGIRALYKGCVPTSVGVAPYVAINFAAYEALRKNLSNEEGEISTLRKLSCGALAGSISQTLTYPLDVLRRRMQVSGMKDSKLGYSDKSSFAAIRTIVKAEGLFGLYRGITPNLLKVAPSIATSFCCYEFVCNLIHPPQHHNHNGHSSHH
ncbi:hypothetical protein CBS101457_004447 [Exobasidium rhododendri]|nr:hypothetical protein CBS101457_004447 [Exobasidium rhododendri]